MQEYKCVSIFLIIVFFKVSVLFLIISLTFRKKTEIKFLNEKIPITTRNLISRLNITNYNLIIFYDYEHLEFNAIGIFKYFRKKYFNISFISYEYDKEKNSNKLEYIIGIYDENKYLIDPKNKSIEYEFSCFHKIDRNFEKQPPIITENNYSKCVQYLNLSETIKFGLRAERKKAFFNIFLDFYQILNPYLSKNPDKLY